MMGIFSRVPTNTLRTLIWLYRHTVSSFMGRQCRFLPTCSEYADEAIRRYGAGKGTHLAIKRLCRCHPWERFGGRQGFDPVPDITPKNHR